MASSWHKLKIFPASRIRVVAWALAAATKGRGKGRGAKISLGRKTTDSNCIVPSCEAKRASQKMFCAPHACSWTGIENQAKAQGQAAMDRVEELKKPCNQADRGQATYEFAQRNPPDHKYTKKQFFDVAHAAKSKIIETARTHREGDRPMTRKAFQKHCEHILGLEDEEITEWWDEMHDNPATDRDEKGHKGRLQLWVPIGESRDRSRMKAIRDEVIESSKPMKNTEADMKMLDAHLNRQKVSMADDFLRDGDEEGRSLLREKRKREEEPEAEQGSAKKLKPRTRKNTFDAERDGPQYWQEIGEQMTKLAPKITAAGTAFDKIMGELTAVKEDDKNSDPACVGCMRKLQHRAQLLWKFSGKRGVVKCFNLSSLRTSKPLQCQSWNRTRLLLLKRLLALRIHRLQLRMLHLIRCLQLRMLQLFHLQPRRVV